MTVTVGPGSAEDGIGALPEFRSGDPIVGSTLALRRDPLTTFVEPYRRFGRIFRMRLLGRSAVVIAGLDANEFAWRNGDQWQLEGATPAGQRKRLVPAFRPRPVQRQVPTMADACFATLADNADRVVDLRALCKRLAVHMAGRALLGVDLPEGAEDDLSGLEHDLLAGAALGPLRRVWFGRPSLRLAGKARHRDLTTSLAAVVRDRRHDWSGDDLISEVLRGLPHGALIPPVDELVTDVMLLLQAGFEPTAHQILWTLLLLQSRPDWTAELRAELETWTTEAAVSFAAFPKLRATILEGERLRPAVPFAVRIAARDLMFSSRRIPQGATVLHAATLTHFLDEIYDDPMAFRPERFLAGSPVQDGDVFPRAHGTYGGGPHLCLGQALARVQVPLAVAVITKHADLIPFGPVSLRARLEGVVTPVERNLPSRLKLRAG